jgi:UDP-N-acetylmuramate dehydrogenase
MNAGGHGSDLAASLRRVMLFDARTGVAAEVAAAALSLGYRRSAVRRHEVVVWAEVELAEGERAASERLVAEIVRWRRRHQPGGQNAGSVFVNPPTDSAGRLVEVAGLKGLRKGSAEVSTKHGNFFQADPDGSADDVRALIDEVARLVDERLGVRLEPEVDLIGFRDTYPFVEVKG